MTLAFGLAVMVGTVGIVGFLIGDRAIEAFWTWRLDRLIKRPHAPVNEPLIQLIKSEHQR